MLNLVPFSPAEIVENVAEIMTIKSREKKLSLMTFIHPDIPSFVRGDPDRLRQILFNLIDNAIKFTEKGEVIVRVEPVVGASPNSTYTGKIQFSVSDTGIGLPEDADNWLFLPFSQADSSTTRRHGGTGLGLAIARSLTEIMGGKIGVHSSQNVGSTFWFTLQLAGIDDASTREPRMGDLKGLRALVIDDAASNRAILALYLKIWGVQCDALPDPQQSLLLIKDAHEKRLPYHLAIIDLMLPGLDGLSLAELLYEMDLVRNTKLVLLTAYDEPGQKEKALKAGFHAYLTKPVKQSQLFEVLTNVMTSTVGRNKPLPAASNQDRSRNKKVISVVLAEGNAIMRRLTKQDFERRGCAVLSASSVVELYEILEKTSTIHLLLVDIQMISVALSDIINKVRYLDAQRGSHTPIIGMGVQMGHKTRTLFSEAGMDTSVTKPLTPRTIQDLLDKWVVG